MFSPIILENPFKPRTLSHTIFSPSIRCLLPRRSETNIQSISLIPKSTFRNGFACPRTFTANQKYLSDTLHPTITSLHSSCPTRVSRTGSESAYQSTNNSSNPPVNYGFRIPTLCDQFSPTILLVDIFSILPSEAPFSTFVSCSEFGHELASEPNRPHSCANPSSPPFLFRGIPTLAGSVSATRTTMSSPPKIPAPIVAYTIPSNTHVTYSSMPSPYSRPAAFIRNYPYTTSTPQRTSSCNSAASPVRPA